MDLPAKKKYRVIRNEIVNKYRKIKLQPLKLKIQ